jgi:hypothetical protein
MGQILKGETKLGGLVGNEEFQVVGLDGVTYVISTSDFLGLITEITNIPTEEIDTSLVLKPDGLGGVLWGPDEGGGGMFGLVGNIVTNSGGGDYGLNDYAFGSPSLDYDSDINHATRIIFDKSKGAFRAGRSDTNNWNDGNRGNYSAAFGFNTIALGSQSMASGTYSFANGANSFAFGYSSTAQGDYSIAGQRQALASAESSMALGYLSIATGVSSKSLGIRTTAESYGEVVIGADNTDYTPASSVIWNVNDRLFVVGNGTSATTKSDAFTVYKSGRIIANLGEITTSSFSRTDGTITNSLEFGGTGIAGGTAKSVVIRTVDTTPANPTDSYFHALTNEARMASYNTNTGNGIHLAFGAVSGTAVMTDTISTKGLVYAADYSTAGMADNRWIPDWGSVTNVGIDTILANSGPLTNNRTLNGTTNDLVFNFTNGNSTNIVTLNDTTFGIVNQQFIDVNNTYRSVINASSGATKDLTDITIQTYNQDVGEQRIYLTADDATVTPGIRIIDTITNTGLVYGDNYSEQAGDRSIIDKYHVEDLMPLFTFPFEAVGTTQDTSNDSIYMKFYVPYDKKVSKIRFQVADSGTTNTFSVQLYDNTGTAVTLGNGSIVPTVSATWHYIDVPLSGTPTLTGESFYWLGIHQASTGGILFTRASSAINNINFARIVTDTVLQTPLPAGTATTVGRIAAQLL